jgi:hypothetical protein
VISRACLLCVAIVLATAGNAFAGYNVIVDAYNAPSPAGAWGPRHSLTSVWATSTETICVNAWNNDGSGWAGATYCASPGNSTSHPYCGCKLREGYVFPYYYVTPFYTHGEQTW